MGAEVFPRGQKGIIRPMRWRCEVKQSKAKSVGKFPGAGVLLLINSELLHQENPPTSLLSER